MKISDVCESDCGHYATIDGKEFNLSGEVAHPGCQCQLCGKEELYEAAPEDADDPDELGDCVRGIYGCEEYLVCSDCLKAALAQQQRR